MRLTGLLVRAALSLALLAPAGWLRAEVHDTGPSDATAVPDSLAGQFLVASPEIGDPRFEQTVILMIGHDKKGALGIAINRPVDEHPIAELLRWIGKPDDEAQGSVLVYAGGPVQQQIGFIVHTDDYHDDETLEVGPGVRMTSSPAILRAMGHQKGPHKALVAFGYSGWGPGQLENELARHAWATAPLDLSILFDTAPDLVWAAAWAHRTVNL
jgi:putative transcriptional regulator